MGVKHFCDSCKKDLGVSWSTALLTSAANTDHYSNEMYELCSSCFNRIKIYITDTLNTQVSIRPPKPPPAPKLLPVDREMA